jgi:hypothetical protein
MVKITSYRHFMIFRSTDGGELAGALYPEIDELIIKLGPLTIGVAYRCSPGPPRPTPPQHRAAGVA